MSTLARVLIVDDEPHIRRLLKTTLARASYDIVEAETAREALERLSETKPDVVLLDLGLPDRDGLELVPIIKKQTTATLLVVSARDATDQKVAALDLGADDYVTKPFDSEELLARVRTALRHRMHVQGAQSSIVAGDVEIDLVNRRVLKGGNDVHLTPKEFGIVAELAKFPGRVITHQQLLSAVWPNDYERHIEYLRVVIRNIRQKIETDVSRPAIIVNELGIGYRLRGNES
ncbi:response regulator [Novosphingobium album (ex Liu et al. 2023)]|uniref:Response regulator transcription factor n=1 Tax=Novosphingobium album (ex Liu et al. 2023) TaxID=3031130 RepID=A0ABT5WV90_9SPHN|nr:response regulator transcription factor [Novosphingobium album (ex Liu et al. 2023)]MDE8653836.1 response regulator transcription factor [Novosphingobium album (ex Liu et al. 2023)]